MPNPRRRHRCRIATLFVAITAGTLAGVTPGAAVANAKTAFKSRFSGGGSAAVTQEAGWPQLHYGPGRAGYQPNETEIGTENVDTLAEARTYIGGTAPLIANGILYVATNKLYAYDATGTSNCSTAATANAKASPVSPTCTPLWTAPAAYFDGMAVADGDVFVTDAEGVQAYDATGSKNCSGTPRSVRPCGRPA